MLVGCGGICGAWLNSKSVQKHVSMVGFVDLDLKAARSRADEFGAPDAQTGKDIKAMLDAVEPDVVFDCTTPNAHAGVAILALKHGCHVLGEKPMADTVANARRMLAAEKASGKTGAVIQNRRFDQGIRALGRFIDSGKLGRIHTVQSNFFIGAHFGGFRDHMKNVLLLDMAIHTFDAARAITHADPLSAYCHEWNPPSSWYDQDASAVAIFEMTNDVVYTYQGSWCSEGRNTSWEGSWHIIGEKGSVTWDGGLGLRAQVVTSKDGFIRETRDIDVPLSVPKKYLGSHDGVIGNFLNAIRTGASPETAYSDNIKSLAMVEAAIKSAEKGRKINITI